VYRGDLDAGDRMAEEALAFGQRTNAPEALLAYFSLMGTLRSYQHRYMELAEMYRGLVASSPGIPVYAWAHASTLANTGELDQAREARRAVPSTPLAEMSRDWIWPTTVQLAAQCALLLGEPKLAAEALALLEPLAHLTNGIASVTSNGSFARFVAMAAAATGDLDAAERYFTAALEANERIFHWPEVALTQRFFAAILLERDRPGDRERALGLLDQALHAAEAMRLPKVIEDCLALKVKAQGLDASSLSLYSSIERVASAAQAERTQVWRDAVAPDGTVTIMFSDIEDSTVLTERLGDARWQELLRQHDAMVRAEVEAHGGYVVKHLGDGFMLAFQSARKALDCAVGIQSAFAKDGALPEPVRVRIGLHAGEAVRENDDFFGKNVVLASRVASKAAGGEILASSVVRTLVESSVDPALFGQGREVELKGLEGTHALYPIAWQTA
jgi:class 3 adenylate cyclase